jgi:hypothetical protein
LFKIETVSFDFKVLFEETLRVFHALMDWKIARTRNIMFRQFEVLFEETLRVSSKNCLKSKLTVSILKWFPAHKGWKIARTRNVKFRQFGVFIE